MSDNSLVNALASALMVGAQQLDAVVERGTTVLGKRRRWLIPLAERYLAEFEGRTRPRQREVVEFLLSDPEFDARVHALARKHPHRFVKSWITESPRMQPAPTASDWAVPSIATVAALAEWLDVTIDELEWMADLRQLGRHREAPRLQHYHYRVVEKRHGGVRLIEAPQLRLKTIQQRILAEILNHVPMYYTAAHGFVKGRSVRTFAAPHVGRRVVLRMDLQDFFPSIGRTRVQGLFRTMGYPEPVADRLGALCTHATPRRVFGVERHSTVPASTLAHARVRYSRAHLPQGAPTSPALANICAYRLDCRLTGLADWAGAVYTRYADDIAFSGDDDFARNVGRYATQIAAIVLDEGWDVQHRKTRVMRSGVSQHLAGLVVNAKINVPRGEFDTLKATLTNCVRLGAVSQNRERVTDFRAHLAGRVAWVTSINPERGAKLRAIFDRVSWNEVQASEDGDGQS